MANASSYVEPNQGAGRQAPGALDFMYTEDLADVTQWYYLEDMPGKYVAVGWLGSEVFTRGSIKDSSFFDQLDALAKSEYVDDGQLGHHTCEICGKQETHGAFYVQADGFRYLAPQMIGHYMRSHAYRPPAAFVAAVVNSGTQGPDIEPSNCP